MRLAIPYWQNRVSPVFDVAGSLYVIDIFRNGEINRQSVLMNEEGPLVRVKQILALNVDTLICGAISKQLERALISAGIEVIPQTCGNVDHVFNAYITNQLQQEKYSLPGCSGRQRRPRSKRRKIGASPSIGTHHGIRTMASLPDEPAYDNFTVLFKMVDNGGISNPGNRGIGNHRYRMRRPGKGSGANRNSHIAGTKKSPGRLSSLQSLHSTGDTNSKCGSTQLNGEITDKIQHNQKINEKITPVQQKRHGVAIIDKGLCMGCGICSEVCQSGAIGLETGIAFIKEDACTGCGECADSCSMGAIQLV